MEIYSDSDSVSSTESQGKWCMDCTRVNSVREEQATHLANDIGLRVRFYTTTMYRHDPLWMVFPQKFLYCSNCLSVLIKFSNDYGTTVFKSDTKLWDQLFGDYKPYPTGFHLYPFIAYPHDRELAYYVLKDYSTCVFENISILVDQNMDLLSETNSKFQYNPIYGNRRWCRGSGSDYWNRRGLPTRNTVLKGVDTHFLHCSQCLEGPVGCLELDKNICYFIINKLVGIAGKNADKKKELPILHHRNLPVRNCYNNYNIEKEDPVITKKEALCSFSSPSQDCPDFFYYFDKNHVFANF